MSGSLACDAAARTPLYAEVALVPAVPGKDLLTYRVPEAERERLRPGMRVLVPLGRRRETGLVVALTAAPAPGVETIRAVEDLLDDEPILTPELFALCRWTARYYLTTLADVVAAALPGGFRASSATVVRLADPAAAGGARASDAGGAGRGAVEAAVLAHLHAAGAASTARLARALGRPGVAQAVRSLARRGLVEVEDRLRVPAGRTRHVTVLALAGDLPAAEIAALERRAPRQRALYERLRDAPGGRLEAAALPAAERAAAAALERRGLVRRLREERYRDARPPAPVPAAPLVPTAEQRAAVDAVAATAGFQAFLLHGVTGSGKTEVYLQLAARAHAAGRSALLLVPEIALTHQLVLRVQERFGSGVALLHSGLGPGERWDEWRRVARGEARVVVGTRSAVFAPLADLGLVIVDEEHDPAYKQDEGLRYHARDLALVRAKLAGVAAVLGSATPSVESWQQALEGKFRLLPLTARVEGRPLPPIELVDLRTVARPAATGGAPAGAAEGRRAATEGSARGDALEESRAAGAHSGAVEGTEAAVADTRLFSLPLLEAMRATLARGHQVLLFLNRRGFAASLQCLACGEPARCPSCTVSLTWHRRRRALLCHHCGYARPWGEAFGRPSGAFGRPCEACGGGDVRAVGEGTERVEREVAGLFPEARIGRLDRDTTAAKGAHRRILDAWRAGELDVLIGTQMVAKGHDVPGVTLVGVLLADVALNMPDFRAGERAFQLMTQVAGRAGRGDAPGRVLVQTFRPAHHSLVAAAAHDYLGFAERELALRREVGYPPFARLAVLRLEGRQAGETERAASDLAARARGAAGEADLAGDGRRSAAGDGSAALHGSRGAAGEAGVVVRGPAPAPLERLRGRWRWQVMLTSPSAEALHRLLGRLLAAWRGARAHRAVRLIVDVDPTSML